MSGNIEVYVVPYFIRKFSRVFKLAILRNNLEPRKLLLLSGKSSRLEFHNSTRLHIFLTCTRIQSPSHRVYIYCTVCGSD